MASAGKTREALATFLGNPRAALMFRVLFGGYVVALTLLLWSPNPYRLVAFAPGAVYVLGMLYPVAHGISFALLTALALLAFRSVPQAAVCVGLSGYASLTELVQRCIPPRAAEWGDWFQDIAGIVLVIFVGWAVAAIFRAPRNIGRGESIDVSASS